MNIAPTSLTKKLSKKTLATVAGAASVVAMAVTPAAAMSSYGGSGGYGGSNWNSDHYTHNTYNHRYNNQNRFLRDCDVVIHMNRNDGRRWWSESQWQNDWNQRMNHMYDNGRTNNFNREHRVLVVCVVTSNNHMSHRFMGNNYDFDRGYNNFDHHRN